jgi:hypothetical protein
MSFQALFGLAGCGLLLVALAATALRLQNRAVRVRYAIALLVAIAVLLPIGDLSLAAYVRGATGDLSITTLALAAGACFTRLSGRRFLDPRDRSALLALAAGAGVFLYPFALGWTPFDPYALGFGSLALAGVLLLVTAAAWRAGRSGTVIVVLAGILAYLAGAYESRNLWDYLIDPLAASYALALWIAQAFRIAGRSFQRRAP